MKLLLILIASSIFISAEDVRIGRLDIWTSNDKSKKLFSFKEGAKLSPAVVLGDQSYTEVEITDESGKKLKPAQVSLLVTDETTGVVPVGAHPSIQIALKTSSAGGSIYRNSFNFTSMRYVNPRGGLFSVSLIVGDDSGKLMHSLGKVTIPSAEDKLNSAADEYLLLPRIEHTFKPPAVSANPLITTIFTILCSSVPLVIFLGGVRNMQVNVKGLSSLTSVAFFGGSAVFGLLMILFFAALNLVQTVAAVLMLGVPMSLIGNRVLSQMRTSGELSY